MGHRSALKLVQSCSTSFTRNGEPLCNTLARSVKTLDTIIPPVAYPKGAVLFMEGQTARGIFAIYSGHVKLFTSSFGGTSIILKIAGAGELIGLPAILAVKPYEVTAEVSEQARVNFIPRAAFLRFLQANPEAVIQVAQLLTDSHYAGHEVIRSLVLSRSASEKLARFFLAWSVDHAHGQDRFRITLTHEEIGMIVGVTRETVTRVLTAFKKKNWVAVNGAAFNICNRPALQALAGT